MGWVWGIDQGKADRQPDIHGQYCGYDFETYSPAYALDNYGIINGYLMGTTKPGRVMIADWYSQVCSVARRLEPVRRTA